MEKWIRKLTEMRAARRETRTAFGVTLEQTAERDVEGLVFLGRNERVWGVGVPA